jgi:hypothetical protein
MKIQHKPFTKQKARKGKGQKNLTNFKSREEYKTEIHNLEEQRYRYYLDLVKNLQQTELDFKRAIIIDKTKDTYVENSETYKKAKQKYDNEKRNHIDTFNELVKPIDKELKTLRIEVLQHYSQSKSKIDTRL